MRTLWKKSSFSQGAHNCVELYRGEAELGVRDSKNTDGHLLVLTARQGAAFLSAIKRDRW